MRRPESTPSPRIFSDRNGKALDGLDGSIADYLDLATRQLQREHARVFEAISLLRSASKKIRRSDAEHSPMSMKLTSAVPA